MRNLLALLALLGLTGCTSATRVSDPAEILGFRAKTKYAMSINSEAEQDDCVALLLLRAENARLKKDLEDEAKKPDPAPEKPVEPEKAEGTEIPLTLRLKVEPAPAETDDTP